MGSLMAWDGLRRGRDSGEPLDPPAVDSQVISAAKTTAPPIPPRLRATGLSNSRIPTPSIPPMHRGEGAQRARAGASARSVVPGSLMTTFIARPMAIRPARSRLATTDPVFHDSGIYSPSHAPLQLLEPGVGNFLPPRPSRASRRNLGSVVEERLRSAPGVIRAVPRSSRPSGPVRRRGRPSGPIEPRA